MPRDWLGRTSMKWPTLCRVGRKTLTQSINSDYFILQQCQLYLLQSICTTESRWQLAHSCYLKNAIEIVFALLLKQHRRHYNGNLPDELGWLVDPWFPYSTCSVREPLEILRTTVNSFSDPNTGMTCVASLLGTCYIEKNKHQVNWS